MRNIQKHTVACDTMNIHMQRQTTGMPYLLKDKQCIQQITRPRMGKKTQAGIHSVWTQFTVMPRTQVRQFTLVHIAKCHSTTS